MVSYNVITSPKALQQLESYIDYIQYTLFNNEAADSVWQDALNTVTELENVAGSLLPCKHPKLKKLGYHPMFFLAHQYVMLYRLEGTTVFVDGIYHQLQDYENLFAKDI